MTRNGDVEEAQVYSTHVTIDPRLHNTQQNTIQSHLPMKIALTVFLKA